MIVELITGNVSEQLQFTAVGHKRHQLWRYPIANLHIGPFSIRFSQLHLIYIWRAVPSVSIPDSTRYSDAGFYQRNVAAAQHRDLLGFMGSFWDLWDLSGFLGSFWDFWGFLGFLGFFWDFWDFSGIFGIFLIFFGSFWDS